MKEYKVKDLKDPKVEGMYTKPEADTLKTVKNPKDAFEIEEVLK